MDKKISKNRKIKIKKKKVKLKQKIPKLKPIVVTKIIKPKLKKIKIIGYWCEYYPGRLPSPIECSYNKSNPLSVIFIHGEKKIVRNTPNCPKCKRYIRFPDWKAGLWDKVKHEIEKGADLRDQPSPSVCFDSPKKDSTFR